MEEEEFGIGLLFQFKLDGRGKIVKGVSECLGGVWRRHRQPTDVFREDQRQRPGEARSGITC